MRKPSLLLGLNLLPSVLSTASPKRGLIHIPNAKHPQDDTIWIASGANLTWYYNYGFTPSGAYRNSNLQFVPMFWGTSTSGARDEDQGKSTTFLDSVTTQIKQGTNITYALAFNEPDGESDTGGSPMSAKQAAEIWIRQLEPLRKLGVQVGAPAVTGSPRGLRWLDSFFDECDGECNPDFMPVHWYGNFEGMESYIGQVMEKWPEKMVWVTEWGLPRTGLEETKAFFNTSCEYFDRTENITRYSYFGSFRSVDSNVGPNAAMLTQDGKLTDIGSWYLGGAATNNIPKGAAQRVTPIFMGWSVVVVLIELWLLV